MNKLEVNHCPKCLAFVGEVLIEIMLAMAYDVKRYQRHDYMLMEHELLEMKEREKKLCVRNTI